MTKNLVGKLIGNGSTTVQIQKRIKEFPTNPTIEYFMNLGYAKSTAKTYISLLKKNNLEAKEEPKAESGKKKNVMRGSFICSENADKNNLILDTCALGNKETINIIEKSTKVTVLLSTLNEMEEKKRKKSYLKNDEIFLNTMIGKFGKKFLRETEKYRLVPFVGDNYNDNNILKYLMQQPVGERQTIITADILFADRARCLGLDYIFFERNEKYNKTKKDDLIQEAETEKVEDKKTEEVAVERAGIEENNNSQIKNEVKEDNVYFYELGVRGTYQEGKILIKKYNYQAEVFWVKGEKCESITGNEAEIDRDVDYIAVVCRINKYNCIKVFKEMVKDPQRAKEENIFNSINEIYKSEGKLHEDILECCKNLL